ncbi:type III secretion system effector protein [Xanthomonas oryzae]|uniref:type III secretion system effector XopQ n=1 Tax=Xanthomonas oryzae TaxID=347 RepID=UPI001034BAD0|nr:type III secretion system effector XopQ [Xanthomonas oryzae]QBG89918.1 type III secretion system effector protein [Xanthomonas oryzae]QBH05583.1 type III secretion system effector protein [Xanthomonas oryzae]
MQPTAIRSTAGLPSADMTADLRDPPPVAVPAHSAADAATPPPSALQTVIGRPPRPDAPRHRRTQSLPARLTPAQRSMLAELGVADTPVLTPTEAAVLRELRLHRPQLPLDTLLFTDPNKDPDDVVTYTIAKQLQADGFLRLTDVVVTLGDADMRSQRAQLAKGVFDRLALPDVRVARGQDYPMTSTQAREHSKFLAEGAALRAAPDAVHTDGVRAMRERLATSPHKLGMVVIAGMTDASALLAEAGDLVREKVASITIMGGIDPARDADGLVQPDTRAYNNATDIHAARALYRRAQQLGIPLRILTKEAAYKAAVPPAFYEGIARNGHPVGEYLRDVQKNALKGLWEGIQANLIPGLDTAWFFRTFVAAQPQDPVAADQQGALSFDAIWPQVTKLNLYDPLTLLAALPGTARLLFQPTPMHREGASPVEHVGHAEVVRPEKARLLLSALAKAALVQQDEGQHAR